jgi:intein/homing endonuclease
MTITVGEISDLIKQSQEFGLEYDIKVLSKNVQTNEISYKSILKAWQTDTNREVIKITDETTGKSLTLTPNHPIWTLNRGWVNAGDLQETDELDII